MAAWKLQARGSQARSQARGVRHYGRNPCHPCHLWSILVLVWLAGAGLIVAVGAGASVEKPLTPALSPSDGEREKSEPRYRVTRWTVENGLPQNSIKALAQTRDGYLWLGTLKGLARFDGVRFKVFDHSTTPEMTHDSINDLAVDTKDGGLWIGTGAGLLHYRGHQFKRYGTAEGVTEPVGPLCPAHEGGMWFSLHPGQVSLAREGRVQTYVFGPDRAENTVHQLGEENSAQLLVLLGEAFGNCKVHRLNLNTKSLALINVPAGATPVGTACSSFLQDADESLWLCTGQGLWRGNGTIVDADHERGCGIEGLAAADLSDARWPGLGHAVRRRSR